MNSTLSNRVAVITGAAGSIGATTAERLLDHGAYVVLTDIDAAALEREADRLRVTHPDAVASLSGDAADGEHVSATIALAVDRFGGLDIVFANAGMFGEVAPIADYREEVFAEVLRVNVLGPFLLCKHAFPVMRDGGCVILTSSVVGLTSDPGIAAYATSKHALVGLMRTAAKEVAARGIRVNTIHPGPVDNGFQHSIEMTATGLDQGAAATAFEQMIPLGRHARAEEIAALVTYLAGPEGAFITGATLPIDGGMSV